MKTKVLQEKLQKSLNQVEKITGKDITLPILSNILLTTEKNQLVLTATNLETGISWKILSKTEETGSIIVPAQTFSSLIDSFPGGAVNIETKGLSVVVSGERRKSILNGIAVDEFPLLPTNSDENKLTIRADVFCQALGQVLNFTSISSIKPEITGVYFGVVKNKIKIVATDSFRLGEKTITLNKNQTTTKDQTVILPFRAAREIVSVFGDIKENITIFFDNNQLAVDYCSQNEADSLEIRFVTRLIEGEFPDYQVIIPTDYAAEAVFTKKELINHLKSASLFSGKNNEVVFNIVKNDKIIKISSQSVDLGGYESEVGLDGFLGENISIIFNCRYLVDGLNSIKEDKCRFRFSGDDGPGVLSPTDSDDFIYIIMPIKKD